MIPEILFKKFNIDSQIPKPIWIGRRSLLYLIKKRVHHNLNIG